MRRIGAVSLKKFTQLRLVTNCRGEATVSTLVWVDSLPGLRELSRIYICICVHILLAARALRSSAVCVDVLRGTSLLTPGQVASTAPFV